MIHPPHTLDLWHAALNDHRSLMSQPDWHCDLLRRAAAQAYANEATANQWFRPNRLYAVEHQGAQVGRIEHGGFMPSPGSPDKFMAGLIRHDECAETAARRERGGYCNTHANTIVQRGGGRILGAVCRRL
ncbi:hypothetical protein ACSEQ4_12180 [Pseudomonas aeruginosa]